MDPRGDSSDRRDELPLFEQNQPHGLRLAAGGEHAALSAGVGRGGLLLVVRLRPRVSTGAPGIHRAEHHAPGSHREGVQGAHE